jgi:long-chain acyl-CoA synthetase
MTRTFCQQLIDAAVVRPAKVAMVRLGASGREETTFGEMLDQVRSLAYRLACEGIERGDRVAILGENHPHWAMLYLAILYRGAVVVPLDPAGSVESLAVFLDSSEAKMVFVAHGTVEKLRSICHRLGRQLPSVTFGPSSVAGGVEASEESLGTYLEWAHTRRPSGFDAEPPPASHEEMAILIYTSGTTGVPKAVPLTHGNIVAETGAVEEAMRFSDREVILSLLPLFHAYSQIVNLWIATLIGATVVYISELTSEEILRGLKEGKVTALTGVPRLWYLFHKKIFDEVRAQPRLVRGLFAAMLEANGWLRDRVGINLGRLLFRRVHEAFGGKLRLACSGGSSFDAAVARDYHKLGFTVLQAYGLSETSGAATATRFEDNRVGSVGKPLGSVQVKIDGPDAEGIGEVLIRGPIVMAGYYRNPAASAEAFTEDGWFRSGDLGRFDADGHLYITGRRKEVIVLPSGKNVYPEEVEAQYLRSPLVSEVCVMGVRDPESEFAGAEKLVAVVVPDSDYLQARQVLNARHEIRFSLDSLGRELPEYQRVRDYLIRIEPLPRTPTRKIRRFELQRQIEAEGGLAGSERDLNRFDWSEVDRARMASPAGEAIGELLRPQLKREVLIHPEMSLELDLGLDSLARAETIVALERRLGGGIDPEQGAAALQVRDLLVLAERLIGDHAPSQTGREVKAAADGGTFDWGPVLLGANNDAADLEPILRHRPLPLLLGYLVLRPIYWLARLFLSLDVRGQAVLTSIPAPFLICPNHQSYLDAFLICSTYPREVLDRTFHVGAKMYFANRWMAALARAIHVVPVDAGTHLIRAMRAGAHGLRVGKILSIYPEGHRTFDGQLHEFKHGAAILATVLDLPIVPVAIDGAWKVLPRDSSRLRRAPVQIRFGEPVYPTGHAQEMTAEVRRRIAQLLAEMRAEQGPSSIGSN